MSEGTGGLGAVIEELAATIETRRAASPDISYTASLLAAGPARCAKKFGEEAVEAAIAAAQNNKAALADEAADAIFHLLLLLASAGVTTGDVAAALAARRGVSGHDEKASRR